MEGTNSLTAETIILGLDLFFSFALAIKVKARDAPHNKEASWVKSKSLHGLFD